MKKTKLFAMFASLALTVSPNCFSASTTGNLAISAIVTSQCTVQGSAIPFGNYNAASIQQNANIGVTCSSGTSYTISLDAGTGSGANTSTRKLANADGSGATLSYALYQDSGRTKTWGNSNGSDTLSGVGNGNTQSIPVYGYIPAGQASKAGSYSDVVAITLSY